MIVLRTLIWCFWHHLKLLLTSQPCLIHVPTQSLPVSPPPITITSLSFAEMYLPSLQSWTGWRTLCSCCVEIYCKVYSIGISSRSIGYLWLAKTTRKYYSIIICHKLFSLVRSHQHLHYYELNAFFLHNIKLSVNYMLFKSYIRMPYLKSPPIRSALHIQ